MSDVTAGGPGFVAVGIASSQDIDAAVWTSTDGLAWTRVPHDDTVLGGEGDQWMHSVTVGGPGLVAVGSENRGDFDAAVWTSEDGLSWTRLAHDEVVLGGDGGQDMTDVTGGGPGLVAVGVDGARAAAWTSVDGITWSRVPGQDAFDTEANALIRAVTGGGQGVVAVGEVGAFGSPNAAVWTSEDGVAWSRVPHDESVFGGEGGRTMESVTVGGPGLVAVGTHSPISIDWDAAVWTSLDGLSWTRAPRNDRIFAGEGFQVMDDVAVVGPWLMAVGSAGGEEDDAAVWISSDGSDWLQVVDDPNVFGGDGYQIMRAVASNGDRVVAVGVNSGNPAVWTTAVPK